MKPFLQWAGGKRQLLNEIRRRMPRAYNRYYEPFLGGGAVLFALAPPGAIVGDQNAALINLYTQIKAAPEPAQTPPPADERRTAEERAPF